MTDAPAIETRDLTRRYGDVTALEGLSLTVDRGELYGFLGPNGAGKSTTINVLTGQLEPDDGTARVAGVDPVADPVGAREVTGILPENGRPPSFLTVREYFDFVAAARDLDEGLVDDRVGAWADRLEFRHKLDTLCTDLSQGERQKVLVAQAFLHEPEVVFIDEPLTNLDPIMQERVKRFFTEYRREGNTLFLSTHFISTAEEVCTRVGIINRGRLLAETDPRELDDDETLLDRFFAAVEADSRADAPEPGPVGMAQDPAAPGAGSVDGNWTGAESRSADGNGTSAESRSVEGPDASSVDEGNSDAGPEQEGGADADADAGTPAETPRED